jgi:hypothetical protein
MSEITMAQASKLYDAGNDAGNGYEVDGDTVSEAAEQLGGEIVLRASNTSEVYVVRVDGKLVAIGGDGMGREPWAVTIS